MGTNVWVAVTPGSIVRKIVRNYYTYGTQQVQGGVRIIESTQGWDNIIIWPVFAIVLTIFIYVNLSDNNPIEKWIQCG